MGEPERLRQVVHALLLEWTFDVEVSRGMKHVDFVTSSLAPLGLTAHQRFRLFLETPQVESLVALRDLASARQESPIAITTGPMPVTSDVVAVLGLAELESLIDQSGVVGRRGDDPWTIDGVALGDLVENLDTRLAMVNGLVWLRALARDRTPPGLRMTGRPAHELFERCFFTVMTSTFGARGTSWGTERRGEVRPDGLLDLPNGTRPVIYDCKASYEGYRPTYRDILGFADYVRHPVGWTPPQGVSARFLVVSSGFRMSGTGSFRVRSSQLATQVPGVDLSTIQARDLVRFAIHLERANLPLEGRLAINWDKILASGQVQWADFESQLNELRSSGFTVDA